MIYSIIHWLRLRFSRLEGRPWKVRGLHWSQSPGKLESPYEKEKPVRPVSKAQWEGWPPWLHLRCGHRAPWPPGPHRHWDQLLGSPRGASLTRHCARLPLLLLPGRFQLPGESGVTSVFSSESDKGQLAGFTGVEVTSRSTTAPPLDPQYPAPMMTVTVPTVTSAEFTCARCSLTLHLP